MGTISSRLLDMGIIRRGRFMRFTIPPFILRVVEEAAVHLVQTEARLATTATSATTLLRCVRLADIAAALVRQLQLRLRSRAVSALVDRLLLVEQDAPVAVVVAVALRS